MSENIRSTAQTCTHGVMSRWPLLFLTAGMIALAGCDGRPAATLARPDSTKNAAAEVARGTDPDDAQGAGASDSVTHSRMSRAQTTPPPFDSIQGAAATMRSRTPRQSVPDARH
jgi:hypothetical protein